MTNDLADNSFGDNAVLFVCLFLIFFWMWTIFKICIAFVTILLLFYFFIFLAPRHVEP